MSSNQRGFTLVEVLVAASIVTVALTAVAAGFQYALGVVEASRQQTTAVFLATQRLEQVKARALVDFEGVTVANFPPENPVIDHPEYRRVVEVWPSSTGVVNTVRVQVTVAYRPVAATFSARGQRMVMLATVLSRRQ
jgi:prepilin-type N-terminal cleavage/methylation domain-containing protein